MTTQIDTKRLGQLAKLINRCQDGVEDGAKSVIEMARDMGDFLIEAKATVPHGEWQTWLEENCSRVNYRQTSNYMRLARKWEEIESAKVQSTALLSIDEALDLVKEPKAKKEPDGQAEGQEDAAAGDSADTGCDSGYLGKAANGQPVQGDLLDADDEPVDLDAKPRPEFVGYNLDDEPTPRVFLAEFCALWEEADDMGRLAIAHYALGNLQEFRDNVVALPEKPANEPKRTKKTPGKNGKKPAPYTDTFEDFWCTWRSGKRKVKKGDAFKAWQKALDSTDVDTIMEAVDAFMCSPEGLGTYCPGPTPWLNGRRWEDDRESWQNGGDDQPEQNADDVLAQFIGSK